MLSIPAVSECQAAKGGNLYVVATPIGNLYDITLRALGILNTVDVVAAEDTRHTGLLLAHYGIKSHLVSCHEFNEGERAGALVERMTQGESMALVSDAGTPSVSDPGYRLVRLAIEKGINVIPIPGVSAAITALCASGLSTDSFVFIGFLSRKNKRRKEQIAMLGTEQRTMIFYESPRRVVVLLEELKEGFGDRMAVLARELTKIHEEFIRGDLSRIIGVLSERPLVKGECTVLVSGACEERTDWEAIVDEIRERLTSGSCGSSSLARELAEKHGMARRTIYEEILRLQSGNKE